MNNYNPIVGLFGTCGKSTWRKNFISTFNELGINFFNPQVENWTPECAEIEAQHLVDDDIILFTVTNETTGYGSLAETGFSILQTVMQGLLVYLHPDWKTADLHRACVDQIRGDEIVEWLSRHPEVTHYAIIDDDVDMTLEQKRDHFIKTDAMNGFMYEHYKSLTEILEVNIL